MKKTVLSFFSLLLLSAQAIAQTWTGATSSDWNVGSNWNSGTVPLITGNILIPSGPFTNWPQLTSNVTVSVFVMNAGSQIDFNGFTLTTNSVSSVTNATLNNSNSTTDIVLNSNSQFIIDASTINDKITINHSGTGNFYEASSTNGNTYNSDVIFNMLTASDLNFCVNFKSTFNGNLSINRTVAGSSNLFYVGHNGITGNFSYTNSAGGTTSINANGNPAGSIGGTINIVADGTGTPSFFMRNITNNTAGGTVTLAKCEGITFYDNTLKANVIVKAITGVNGSNFQGNGITGNFEFGDSASNTGYLQVSANTITGNTIYNLKSTATLYEAYSSNANTYNGNVNANVTGTGDFYMCIAYKSTFNGNLSIVRTAPGTSHFFNAGHNGIAGNFSYTNTAGGNTLINAAASATGEIAGTINILANGTTTPNFDMRRIKNNTAGGTITIANSNSIEMYNDTLLANVSISALDGAAIKSISHCMITGDLGFSDAIGNTHDLELSNNTIIGNTSYNHLSPTNWYINASGGKSIYKGNLTINNASGNNFYAAYSYPTEVQGNLVFNSTSGIIFNDSIIFSGNTSTTFEQTGTQPISMTRLKMLKTSSGNLTLNDSLIITNLADFLGGNIISTTTNSLVFANNAIATNASSNSKTVGYVAKIGNQTFTFPLGTTTTYNPIGISAPTNNLSRFLATYTVGNPASAGYDTSLHALTVQKVSGCEYWNLDRIVGTDNVNVTLYYNAPCAASPFYVSNYTDLHVMRWDGLSWEDHGNGSGSGTNTGSVGTAAPVTSFSPFTIGSTNTSSSPLPLALASFTAQPINTQVRLDWEMLNQEYVHKYAIEHSTSADNFSKIEEIKSTNSQQYSYIHSSPTNGWNYYRLRIINNDGNVTYSKTEQVLIETKDNVVISPNPTSSVLYIQAATPVNQINIQDIGGRNVLSMTGNKEGSYNVSNLSIGVYFIKIHLSNNNIVNLKFVKQ